MRTPPAFFTSIPKCGKNVIYSFFFALGYTRYTFVNTEFNKLSNLDTCAAYPNRDHYLDTRLPDEVSPHVRETARESFVRECASQPDKTVSHRHLHADPAGIEGLIKQGSRPIFVYRDPRACLISAVHWARKGLPTHVAALLDGMSVEDAACALLTGHDRLVPFRVWFDAYRGLRETPGVIAVRFEDIIGPQGGGTQQTQDDVFRKILSAAEIEVPNEIFDKAVAKAFNPRAGTFRTGQIDAWRNEFSPRIAAEFERQAGRLFEDWGYAG